MHCLLNIYLLGFLQNFIDWIIDYGGLYILLLVVFAETGLFVGFFFPGDSLLFAAGVFLDKITNKFVGVPQGTPTDFYWPHATIILMIIVASILGNMVGYWFGKKAGPLLYERRDTLLFKKKHLVRARAFYDQYGKGTIFLAKFLPIIRTFAPIVAGMVKMNRSVFMLFNIIGSASWVAIMMLSGYFLDSWFKRKFHISLQDHIEVIAIGLILVTTLPVLYKLFFGRRETSESSQS
ncbi:MAG TPA: VTT domain-containing protein [Chitinophagaceae bacterium]|jgi:membrane-associated protein